MIYDKTLLSKRFRPLYWAAFLQGLIFWYSIEKLFMNSIGFNNSSIALTIIILTVVATVANIPTGILADRWSRTGVLILASLEMVTASLVGGLSHGFWPYVIAACASGLFMASYQGTYDSIVYDTLKEESVAPNMFSRYYSRLRFYDGAALVLGSLLSAFIVHFISLRATYFLTIPFALASIIMLLIFKEPKEHKNAIQGRLLTHITATAKAVFHSKQVMWIGLNLILVSVVSSVLLGFGQLWFIALALPLFLYGPFDAILLSSFSVGGFLSEHLKSKRLLLLVGILSLLSAFALTIHQVYIVVIAQTIILIGMVIYSIVFGQHLHDNLASNVRVGSASIVSTVSHILFLPLAYLVGRISDRSGIFHASWIVIILLVVLSVTSTKVIFAHREDG